MAKIYWKRRHDELQAKMRREQAGRRKDQDKRAEAERELAGERAKSRKERARRMKAERGLAAAEAKCASLQRGKARLAKRVEELERVMKVHDNPHTPSSRKTPAHQSEVSKNKNKSKLPKNRSPRPKSGRKPGGQKGHEGKTSKPKPDAFEEHDMHKCAGCGSDRIHETGLKIRDITELPPPPKATTTRHTIHVYECGKCGAKDMEPETGLPRSGALGSGVIAEMGNNYLDRMPNRMNAERMAHMGLRVSTGTVSNKINGLGRNLSGPAAAILAVLLNAHVLHIDETSFKVNGKIIWVWIFLDPVTESALYVLRPSRGRDVLKEVLAGFKGTIVCDGWQPYRAWRIQRCCAHIIREARYLHEAHPRSAAARDIHERLKRVHQLGLDAQKRRMSSASRVRLRAALLGRVTRILNEHRGNPTASPFLTKLEGAADDLFEFVLDPRVDSTNNAAERGLREIVIHRKIRGTLRSLASLITLGNLFTCAVTWKNQGLDRVAELRKYA